MKRYSTGWLMAGCFAVALSGGCQVDQERAAEAPDVDVDIDPGQWPDYDVKWADVDVGTTERTIEVPVVRVVQEKREVSVPFIDINPPGARDREERTISMELEVPNAGHQLRISQVWAAGDDLWVIGHLTQGEQKGGEMTRLSDHVVVNAPADLDVRKIIVGQRPAGVYNQQYRFVESDSQLQQLRPQNARMIFQR